MVDLLKDKKILVGVTGSIAIYKTIELIRLFIKSGADVRVIMSEESKKFVTPLLFEAISQNVVLHAETESWANDNNHIHIGKWAEIFIIAPISANTINKIANAIADNLLTQTVLAYNKQIIIAPSANTNMILHKSTQESLKKLVKYSYKIIDPQDKLLACNDKGLGAMAEPNEIYWSCCSHLLRDDFWFGKNIIITSGGVMEKIDSVRYIGNFSSGKMAKALAISAYFLGANVTFLSTKEVFELPKDIKIEISPSSSELKISIEKNLKQNNYLFMVAAVSDYICGSKYKGKLKKEELGKEFLLPLIRNVDILKSIDKSQIKTIGFKAELDKKNALSSARKMLIEKELDAVCLNVIDKENHFGSEENEVTLITANKEVKIELNHKINVAFRILSELKNI